MVAVFSTGGIFGWKETTGSSKDKLVVWNKLLF